MKVHKKGLAIFLNLFFTNIRLLFMVPICYHSLSFDASPQKGVSYFRKHSRFYVRPREG